MQAEQTEKLINTALLASISAASKILKIYNNNNFNIEFKDDNSPLTQADKNAHETIISYLNNTNIPVLSEEGKHLPYSERKKWEYLWIVDPLDGTKEFIKKNGEFTVNIALIKEGKSLIGIIYAPVLKKLYFNYSNNNAYLVKNINIDLPEADILQDINQRKEKLPTHTTNSYSVVASRSHLSDKTKEFINSLKEKHSSLEITNIGSSLKLCLLAEGKANIYPRFAPTMEWDIAAGHAILKAAGGNVINTETNKELEYNKENLLNPWFIAESEE